MPTVALAISPITNWEKTGAGAVQTSVIYQGDNLKILADVASKSVDLVYIDPPFNSGRTYETFWGEDEEKRLFEDRFGDIDKYTAWMRPRLKHLARVLKPTGCMYVHCDPHANYRLRMILQDELLMQFRSEIVWKRSSAHSDGKQGRRQHGRVHDTILFFTKSDDFTWNRLYTPYDETYTNAFYKHVEKETGRRYKLGDITGPGGASKGNPSYEVMGVTRYWRYSRAKMEKLIAEGRIIQTKPGNVPLFKQYLDEMPGVPLQDLWTDIRPLSGQSKEREGYPTQKPLALLERIIGSSSNEGDVVLDAFCGCGTSLVAAANLGRQWVGIDQSPTACNVVAERIERRFRIRKGTHFQIVTRETDLELLRDMRPWDFQNWAIIAMGGRPNRKKGPDMGIDGRLVLFDPEAPVKVQKALSFGALTGKQVDLFDRSTQVPVQVKQREKVGRPDVDSFQTALRREKCKMGVIVAFSFAKDAHSEAARALREDGVVIHLFTAEQLLAMQAA